MNRISKVVFQCGFVPLCLCVCLSCFAAPASAAPQRPGDPGSEDVEIDVKAKESPGSHTSITGRFLETMRSPIGFSLGIFESSSPDFSIARSGSGNKSAYFTMVQPRIFANARSGRSLFQFDYAYGYTTYNGQRDRHSSEHSGGMSFDYRVSSNVSLKVTDTFRSAVNEYGVLQPSASPVLYQPNFAQALYVPGERATTNSLLASFNFRASKKSNVSVFTSYDIWRYGATSFGNTQGVQLGIRSDYRINKWLYLDNSYSQYLNTVATNVKPAGIQRLQVGGFKFKLGRSTELYMSGGADATSYQGVRRGTGSFEGGITKTYGSTLISLVYHRGFSNAIGSQSAFNGHIVSASLNQWLTPRANFQIASSYNRGAALGNNATLEYLSGSADFQWTLHSHVLFSLQSSYISQRGTYLPTDALGLSRYTVRTGLQFFFPSFGKRQRIAR